MYDNLRKDDSACSPDSFYPNMPKTARNIWWYTPFLQSHDVHASYRYCPEAEQLRQEQEEIQLRRRVREAVNAELAALAVPTAASRNGSFELCEKCVSF
jgi:hypothetical protein